MADKDRLHGSLEILDLLYREFKEGNLNEDGLFEVITQKYPSFAILYSFYDWIISHKNADLELFLKEMSENRLRVKKIATNLLASYKKVFTYSRSSQVLEVLKEVKNLERVYITESRPGREGILVASELLNAAIPVVLGIDMAMEEFISEAECVILGSDALFEDSFVNKIGTGIVVKLAKEYKKPVFVLSLPEKRIKEEYKKYFKIENEPPEEIFPENHPFLNVENKYFEFVPLSPHIRLIV